MHMLARGNPLYTSGLFHLVSSYISKGHRLDFPNYDVHVSVFLKIVLSWQTVQTVWKCHVLQHFISVLTVFQSIHSQVFPIKKFEYMQLQQTKWMPNMLKFVTKKINTLQAMS